MINPNNKLFRWGPIDGLPIYPDYWYMGFEHFRKDFPPGWPEVLMYSFKEKFICIVGYQELYDAGEIIFKNNLFNDKQFAKNYKAWEDLVVKLTKHIGRLEKQKLSKDNIFVFLKEWNDFYGNEFWNVGSLPEVANWGGEQLLERELRKRIKNETDFNFAFERLTAPEDYSFYQIEELDLLRLKDKTGAALEQGLAKHQQKYFWLLNSYHGIKVLPINYFKKRLDKESSHSARQKIAEMRKHKAEAAAAKEKVIKKFKLPATVLKISRRLSFSIWWQDTRKSYIFQANHIIVTLLKGLAKIYGLNDFDLHYYTIGELEDLAQYGTALDQKELLARENDYLAIWDQKKIRYLSGKPAVEAFKPYQAEKVDSQIKEFKGMVVNRGYVKGTVKVLLSPKESGKVKKGDILVASMTSPDYIVALKKAAAVITDEGGMTCHAAIVSRELKIPGIVAAKIATKVLKDGDVVEVDAEKGVVRIINKAQ